MEAYLAADQYHERRMEEDDNWRDYREAVVDHLQAAIGALNNPRLSIVESNREAFYHVEEAHSIIVNGDYDFK